MITERRVRLFFPAIHGVDLHPPSTTIHVVDNFRVPACAAYINLTSKIGYLIIVYLRRNDARLFFGRRIAGQTLGLVGYGELGQAVARLADAFDMRVLVVERPGAAYVRDFRAGDTSRRVN